MAVNSITYCIMTIITTNMNALKNLFIVMFYSHSMSNIPEVRIYLVRTQGVIEQILKVIGAISSYNDFTARNAVGMLTNIAQCKETQPYLLQEEIIENVHYGVSNRKQIPIVEPAEFQQLITQQRILLDLAKF